jgi:hypothetical protein
VFAREVISIESGLARPLKAHEDSGVLVLVTGGYRLFLERSEELDLREDGPTDGMDSNDAVGSILCPARRLNRIILIEARSG